jgi:hypothetical protein
VAEWFKAAVLKTARGRKVPRGFESHPFRQKPVLPLSPAFAKALKLNDFFLPIVSRGFAQMIKVTPIPTGTAGLKFAQQITCGKKKLMALPTTRSMPA